MTLLRLDCIDSASQEASQIEIELSTVTLIFLPNWPADQKFIDTMEETDSYINKEGIKVVDRFFTVPLDYSNPDGTKIRVFARNLVPIGKESGEAKEKKNDLPFLVFLQGGPGFEVELQSNSGFAKEIHEQGYQTLWLDQRGTGLSTAVSYETLPSHLTDEEKAQYFKFFRADSIVNDCETIRKCLLGHLPEDQQKWSILGQSFGGFCAITYLSFHPEGLKEVFTTGGLAPLVESPDPVYEALIARVVKRNKVYYQKYPKDIKRVKEILAYLSKNELLLPNGGRLTPNRWLQLGIAFGMHGGIDAVHQLVFRASTDLEMFGRLSYKTLQKVQYSQSLDGNPLYAVLHEPIYCQGTAPNWSASRALANHHQFHWNKVDQLGESEPVYFAGEMIFPDMFDDYSNLRPLKGIAEILARDSTWGPLYDLEQLARNEVKVSAVTYVEDMYVDFNFAQDTAAKIKNTEQYITNQLFHNGLTRDSKDVMKRLFDLSKRVYD